MKNWIIPLSLILFSFFIPLQCFTIGDGYGVGIQGAVYRYQMAAEANSLIPITREIGYITMGIYTGKTAFSIILWSYGTLLLGIVTFISLITMNKTTLSQLQFIILGILGSSLFYLASCVLQYGPFFSGPKGISMPCGIILLICFASFLYFYSDIFCNND